MQTLSEFLSDSPVKNSYKPMRYRAVWWHLSVFCAWLATGTLPCTMANDLQAKRIQSWEFQRNDDRNSDQWPDGWRRQIGRDYPQYIPMRIVPRDIAQRAELAEAQLTLARIWTAAEQRQLTLPQTIESLPEPLANLFDRIKQNDSCLEIRMDGGMAELVSPLFELDPRFGYSIEGEVACDKLDGYRAWFELALLDDQRAPIRTEVAPEISGTVPWRFVSTRMYDVQLPNLKYGQIVIKIEPQNTRQITGIARFDSLHLVRIPRLTLACKAPHHVISPNAPVEISCHASGLQSEDNQVRFQLVDHAGVLINEELVQLKINPSGQESTNNVVKSVPRKDSNAPHYVSKSRTQPPTMSNSGAEQLSDGTAIWKLSVPLAGFYRVRVDLGEASRRLRTREISLAVFENTGVPAGNPYGLSFPHFTAEFVPSHVPQLLQLCGANWAKFHVWFDNSQTAQADQLSWLVERLHSMNVKSIGKIDKPKSTLPGASAIPGVITSSSSLMANYFQPNTNWETELEPIILRMSMKLGWFQIGDDHDVGFAGRITANKDVADLRTRIQSYSQEELSLAIPWRWTQALPNEPELGWQATQFTVQPDLTASEMASYFVNKPALKHARWGTLDPLPRDKYSSLDRVRDLCERMIAAKHLGIEACFLTHPLDRQIGIYNPDGSAAELLIPWRTMAVNIGGAVPIGSIDMPSQSTNHVFRNGEQGVMIVWNDRLTKERLYLGDKVEGSDIWGRAVEVLTHRDAGNRLEQEIDVGPWPLVLSGISIPVAEWGQAFQLKTKNLDSSVDHKKTLNLALTNTFGQAIHGKVRAIAPALIQANSPPLTIQLHADGPKDFDMPIVLNSNASAGLHTIRFDFDITADRRYQFSMYRNLTLGLGDVQMDWLVLRQEDGRTILRLELQNHGTQPISFDCKLFPPSRPYQRFQISQANPGRTVREFWVALPTESKFNELWLRCEQIGTSRVLNYRLATPP